MKNGHGRKVDFVARSRQETEVQSDNAKNMALGSDYLLSLKLRP